MLGPMRRFPAQIGSQLVRNLARRRGSENGILPNRGLGSTAGADGEIVASVVLERLPVVLPSLSPAVAAFREFSFEWQQQYRRHYPQEFLDASSNRGEFDDSSIFEPAPSVTEADRTNDHRSLNRALDKRLYLVLHGIPSGGSEGKPVWHFPEKVYSTEPSLRQCAEAALVSLIGDLSNSVYFVGNAPCGHLPSETPALKRFFFRTQLLASELSFEDRRHTDFAWISKEEVPLYFEGKEADFLNKLLR
ncbi:unnamed protein product [Calypogeia fissa]